MERELRRAHADEQILRARLLGNLLIGGLLGILIVDPLTGAMYNLAPEKIEQPLTATQAGVLKNGDGIMVVLLEQTTPAERQRMVRVN